MYSLRILNCKYQTISFIFQDIKIITSLKSLSFLTPTASKGIKQLSISKYITFRLNCLFLHP